MSDGKRKLGGLLVGFGALLALLCCAAPWLLAGFLAALGLGFLLKSSALIGLTVIGVILVMIGLALKTQQTNGKG